MADYNQELQNQAYNFIDVLNRLSEQGNATIFQIADAKNKLESLLKQFPLAEVEKLKNILSDNNEAVKDALKTTDDENKKKIKAEQEYTKQVDELQQKLEKYNSLLSGATDEEAEIINKKKETAQKNLEDIQNQHNAEINGKKASYDAEVEVQNEINKNREEQAKKAQEEYKKKADEQFDFIVNKIITKSLSDIMSKFTGAVDNVANAYNQHAGKLSAALDVTVTDISKLQKQIASDLRSSSLSDAISNVAVMTEMSSLVGSGYTNTKNLESNAVTFAEAKDIAPNLNYSSTTVKDLASVLGSDFITKFAAIQSAVQEEAGSIAITNQGLSKLMEDLEPVYLNAQYQYNAAQASSDVMATLDAAVASGDMTRAQANAYLNDIVELMDPSRAFKSKNVAVKMASMNYDYGSMDILEALEAIQGSKRDMYSKIDTSNTYMGNITKSLYASAVGETNTFDAMLKPEGLYDFEIKHTRDLNSVWNEKESELKEGSFTTRKDQITNALDNAAITQHVAEYAKFTPMIYNTLSSAIVPLINSLPLRIANAIRLNNYFGSGGGATGGSGAGGANAANAANAAGKKGHFVGGGYFTGAATNQKYLTGMNKLNNVPFISSSVFGLGKAGSTVGKLTSGLTIAGAIGAGTTIANMNAQRQEDEKFFSSETWGAHGDKMSAILNGVSVGAGIGGIAGSFIPIPGGNLIGMGIGAIAGGLIGLINANAVLAKAQEENTKAIEENKKATENLFGSNIQTLDVMEKNRELAKGGGYATIKGNDYAIDYKPSTHAGFATGLDFVPYDDFIFRAHRGEAIVTAEAAQKLREKDPEFWHKPKMNEDDSIVGALKEQTESIVNAVNGDKQFSPLTIKGPKMYTIRNSF